jgi:hypothetical protein
MSEAPVITPKPPAPRDVEDPAMKAGVLEAVKHTVTRLDANMLALLAMIVVLNGMFFWALRVNAENRHEEFMYALRSCASRVVSGLDR